MGLRSVLERLRNPVSTLTGLRLRTQYALVLLVILLALGAVVVGSTQFFQQQTLDQEQSDLDQTAELAADQVDEGLQASHERLRGKSTEFEPNLTNRVEVLQSTVENNEFVLALVTDENGTVLDLRGDVADEQLRNETIGSDLSEEPHIQAALEGSSDIQTPSTEADGSISLTMTASILSEETVTENGSSDIEDRIEGVLVGMVLINHGDNAPDISLPGYFRPLQPLNTSIQSAIVEYESTNGTVEIHRTGGSFDEAITSTAQVGEIGSTLRMERDRGAVTERLQVLQYIQFGSLFIVLVSMLGLGFYQYRTNLRQTGRLLDGFESLSTGDFGERLNFTGAREWEQISDGFNAMAAGLREREDAIREREAQIREREQRLSVLNRILRHNLQNDMTVIMGQAQLLTSVESQEKRESAAETIIEMARGLVDHSKKARQLETIMENAEGELVTLDVATQMRQLLGEYSQEYPDFTIEADLPESAPVEAVTGLEFGLESLVENAFEHNDSDDPRVSVEITRGEGRTHVHIRDNGSGIPEHEQEVLRQTEETSLEHGSGIGLWLAYWATEKSQGTLTFEDDAEGGSVTVSLLTAGSAESDGRETTETDD